MKVLVTGGAGFIGAHVVRALLASTAVKEVRVLDDRSTSLEGSLDGLDVIDVHASILDADALAHAAEGVHSIVHLAAKASVPESIEHPGLYRRVNVEGSLRVLDAARANDAQVLLASSAAVYGAAVGEVQGEAQPTDPLTPYAAGKVAAEAHLRAYQISYGLSGVAFRFFNVYGPGQLPGHVYAAVVPAFVDAALAGRPLQVHGTGQQTRDFVYVGSVAAVIADAVRRRATAEGPVNLAIGEQASILDLLGVIEDVLGRSLDRTHTEPRPGDIMHSRADQRRFETLFPEVAAVPLADGIARTVAWSRDAPGP